MGIKIRYTIKPKEEKLGWWIPEPGILSSAKFIIFDVSNTGTIKLSEDADKNKLHDKEEGS